MSGKLDQSLDQIMTDSKTGRARKSGKPRPRRVAAAKAKAAISAPTGGIHKNTKVAKNTGRALGAVKPALPIGRESKIIVSNLPEDVGEAQIKDYFSQMIGSIKKVMLTYGPNGRSRGIATISFGGPESAAKAAQELNGLKVDDKPMRIEVVVGAQLAPAPKTLAQRASLPKGAAAGAKTNGPRNAAKDKAKGVNGATATTTNGTAKAARGKKQGRTVRPKKKTAAELDAEMVDYFGPDGTATTTAAAAAVPTAAAPGGGEATMVDEVM